MPSAIHGTPPHYTAPLTSATTLLGVCFQLDRTAFSVVHIATKSNQKFGSVGMPPLAGAVDGASVSPSLVGAAVVGAGHAGAASEVQLPPR